MSALGSTTTHGMDIITVKLLLAMVVLTMSTIVALVAAIVSRFTPASIAQSMICAGAAFISTATLLLACIVSFTAF